MLIERLYPSSPVELGQDNIHIILDACNALRNGSVTVDDLWPGKKHEMHVLLSEKHSTDEAAHDLLTLRRTFRALERLQLSLRAKIHFTEKNVWPAVLHHGLEMLPDDVLLHILRLCYHIPGVHSHKDKYRVNAIVKSHEDVRRLAQVSRRFSRLAHHLPSLLSDKGRSFSRNRTKEPSILGIPVVSGLHAVLFPASYWGSNTILRYVDKLRSIDSAATSSLSEFCTEDGVAITMPNLKSLRANNAYFLFRCFHLPALQHLDIGEDLPRMLMSQLTSLSFKPKCMDRPKQVQTLIKTLTSASKLQELQLDLRFSGGHFLDFEWNRQISALPDLESLSLSIGFDSEKCTDWNVSMFVAAAAIISSIDAPRLRHVRFYFHTINDDEFAAACPWHEMFPPHRDYSNVQSVELSEDGTELVGGLYPGLLRALSHVKSLILRPTYFEEVIGGIPQLARLRELTLDGCDMNEHDLECVLTRIFSQEEVALERITINNRLESISYTDHLCIPIGWDFLHEKLAKADENVYLDFS